MSDAATAPIIPADADLTAAYAKLTAAQAWGLKRKFGIGDASLPYVLMLDDGRKIKWMAFATALITPPKASQ